MSRDPQQQSTSSPRRRLTPRQLEVLDLVAEGLTTRGVADRLGIGTTTVDTHVQAAMVRLAATTRRQAVAATRLGAVPATVDASPLGEDAVALLVHIAAGRSTANAAAAVGMSERTAHRRLANLRGALQVATTTAATSVLAAAMYAGVDVADVL